ncbi:MAG: MGMT family protein [Bacteroidales bacterium]|nr:MGMT family protein [Bacteroidales bacterium]MDD2322609.1 MGMT family protein [Bacteroidales bacterium]MDD3010018.1 MGMT family protein [Bacteroidales bacterium]MDD3960955.1 MGMT family protein [Bacteroidales bacterium]MDY0285724.1 MGMT family protein [Bacteroidales bacterium]
MTTNFFDRVYAITRNIPYGRVTSYGAIAKYLGAPGSARMVGWALNATKSHPGSIHAHRVVNRQGMLTGKNHFGGLAMMCELLESEGVKIKNDRVQDFETLFWDPASELTIEEFPAL